MLPRYRITANLRKHPIQVAGSEDFSTEPTGGISVEEVVANPHFTFYAFDLPTAEAVFVEIDDPATVDGAAFYYQGQAEHAIGVVRMPLDVFHLTADALSTPSNGFIFVHSTGRCGSTLISRVLAATPIVYSLSEPDDLSQLAVPLPDGLDRGRLLRSGVIWRSKPRAAGPYDHLAIKMRAETMAYAAEFARQFPEARHVFLYRDGLAWMRSIFRGWSPDHDPYNVDANCRMKEGWSRTVSLLREEPWRSDPLNAVQLRITAWIMCMEGYFDLLGAGVPLIALRYEDIVTIPWPLVSALCDFCGIAGCDEAVVREVLAKDSQEGTFFDREARKKLNRVMTPPLQQDVRDMIAARPRLGAPDVVLPGTWRPDR